MRAIACSMLLLSVAGGIVTGCSSPCPHENTATRPYEGGLPLDGGYDYIADDGGAIVFLNGFGECDPVCPSLATRNVPLGQPYEISCEVERNDGGVFNTLICFYVPVCG